MRFAIGAVVLARLETSRSSFRVTLAGRPSLSFVHGELNSRDTACLLHCS